MKNVNTLACLTALGLALTIAVPHAQRGDRVTPPAVPANLAVPAGNAAFLVGHATGTQNYVCLPSDKGFAWSLFTPQATLVNDAGHQIITHFFSPNPSEGGTVRAAWEDSRDSSMFWGAVAATATSATDPNVVKAGAIPWLLISQAGSQTEPTGKGGLTGTTFVQRVNTDGGVAPATGCAQASDVGHRAFVPYKADYFFYRK